MRRALLQRQLKVIERGDDRVVANVTTIAGDVRISCYLPDDERWSSRTVSLEMLYGVATRRDALDLMIAYGEARFNRLMIANPDQVQRFIVDLQRIMLNYIGP